MNNWTYLNVPVNLEVYKSHFHKYTVIICWTQIIMDFMVELNVNQKQKSDINFYKKNHWPQIYIPLKL